MRISKIFVIITIFLSLIPATYADTIYVNINSPGGNGTSWKQAYNNLQTALNNSQSDDQIWVAKGIYRGSFILPSVSLYGGFSGKESLLTQRKPAVNVTVLSGDLNGDDDPANPNNAAFRGDNVAHVLIANGVTATIDGFTIAGGNAIALGDHGGGLLINAGSNISSNNNFFKYNIADLGGGAMYATGSKLVVTRSQFSYNKNINPVPGNNGGGAIFVVLAPSLKIDHSVFNNNFAGEDGGAIRIDSTSGSITDSVFKNNEADHSAGAIVINNSFGDPFATDEPEYHFTLSNLFMANNLAHSFGGALALYNVFGNPANTATVDKSIFLNNKTTYISNDNILRIGGDGGAIIITDLTTSISNSGFYNNTAVNSGGAITAVNFYETAFGLPTRASLTVKNSLFTNNLAQGAAKPLYDNFFTLFGIPGTRIPGGGAINSGAGMVTNIDKSIFTANSAKINGGALQNGDMNGNPVPGFYFITDGTMVVKNSVFKKNMTTGKGGAISSVTLVPSGNPINFPVSLAVDNSTFLNNDATTGNAIYTDHSINTLTNDIYGKKQDVVIRP